MDRLTSKLETMFEDNPEQEREDAENAIKEVNQSSLDDKEKILATVKQNVD
jgi:hypothetical protein